MIGGLLQEKIVATDWTKQHPFSNGMNWIKSMVQAKETILKLCFCNLKWVFGLFLGYVPDSCPKGTSFKSLYR